MPETTIDWEDSKFWTTLVNEYKIEPRQESGKDVVDVEYVKESYFELKNSQDPVDPPRRTFVLFAPNLAKSKIARLIVALKETKIPCGFRDRDAIKYQHVYVFGDVSAERLIKLSEDELDVTLVVGSVFGARPGAEIEQLKDKGVHVKQIADMGGQKLNDALQKLLLGQAAEGVVDL
jgi:hypothetical protein